MPERSAAFQRICTAAVAHFAQAGYDGGSLSEIAASVGIRKASLYSHVAGKDELFLAILDDAARIENGFAREVFAASGDAPGSAYATAIGARFEESAHLRFLLRTAYLPPQIHRDRIGEIYEGFLDLLRDLYLQQLAQAYPDRFSAPQAAVYGDAWLGIVDSLFVELLYAGRERMERRLAALWQVLSDSLACRG